MGLFDIFFGKRQASAGIAKERLQIVLAHERANRDAPDFLPALQRDLIAVVGKYVAIKEDLVHVKLGRQSGTAVLEINIEFDGSSAPVRRPEPAPPASLPAGPATVAPAVKIGPARGKSVGKRR